MHSMSFHGGVVETILFNGWRATDSTGIGWSALGIILLTTLYEGLKSYREHLFIEGARLRRRGTTRSRKHLLLSPLHILQTGIHGVQMIIGYFLMLIFMTYNVWLCLAMVLGTFIGYWLFAWEKSNGENTDCCSCFMPSFAALLARERVTCPSVRTILDTLRDIMYENRSKDQICNGASSSRLASSKYKTSSEIILGWDRFNTVAFLLLFLFFLGWCLAFFMAYVPLAEEDGIDAAHDHHRHVPTHS